MVTKRILPVLLFLILTPMLTGLSYGFSGKVIGVSDGDTITVVYRGKERKVGLYGIECPEDKQAFGREAKQFTSAMVLGKVVEVERMGKDRHDRTIALVAVNKQLLNEELVKAGYAWVYYRHCHEMLCHIWGDLQLKAKLDKRGLWRDPKPVPPWKFRKARER